MSPPVLEAAIAELVGEIAQRQDALKALQGLMGNVAPPPPSPRLRGPVRRSRQVRTASVVPAIRRAVAAAPPVRHGALPPVSARFSYAGEAHDKPTTVGGAMKYLFHKLSALTRAELKAGLLADTDWAKAVEMGPNLFSVNLCGWSSDGKLRKTKGAEISEDRFEVVDMEWFAPKPA